MTAFPIQTPRPTVLVVDDTPANLSLLASLLGGEYRLQLANSGHKALALAQAEAPDLVLLDVMMPGLDGYEVCRRLKADARLARVPVLFLTARTSLEDEARGLALGAVDFIHKPISPPIVAARVRAQLALKDWQDHLQRRVSEGLAEIGQLQDAAIDVMVSLAEFRDENTGNHVRRTSEFVRLLACELARLPDYADELTPATIALMAKSAPLHDIGKIAIPDHILLKPGKFEPHEWTVMQTHAQRGHDILARAGRQMGTRGKFLALAMEIAGGHHEKWDGSGYPRGLAGEAIPLAARLMAVADVFDALMARRPYKEPMTAAQAAEFIVRGRGAHFDPAVVDAFLRVLPACERVALSLADERAEALKAA
ncbi:HD domain-containing phosphohydrolase [Pseudoduganella namucuonensis]|uniref:Putative two-component system response regulator n=1 Tax=Pseudoduganella namucuonensis TaxID=1035707 RepID=A0A1I7LMZ7_9BURK|nr:HD domain-containing phosphohydrolase [Pseudoduganella namucuonensis]SFV11061.1 putative two-component system response regulator [Pseudoduganella namucuonensis]